MGAFNQKGFQIDPSLAEALRLQGPNRPPPPQQSLSPLELLHRLAQQQDEPEVPPTPIFGGGRTKKELA